LNDRARNTERSDRARGERAGNAGSGSRPSQIDRGTMSGLERDRAARSSGAQRSRDFGTYNRSRSSGNMGGSRGGGGFSRGGGGGFRGGGRR